MCKDRARALMNKIEALNSVDGAATHEWVHLIILILYDILTDLEENGE